jgi:DNA (cytosine-5)-methyltransferase 1
MVGGSLFTGIAGLDMGLDLAGAVTSWAWQCEKDPHARAVLAHHYPTVKRYEDVREVDEHAARPDLICGGFPCQDISNAGKRAGIDGERSGLWAEFARIVRVLRPRVVFVENVRALLVRGADRVLGDLAELGFDAEWEVFRASDVGAPHLRERLFVLAYSDRDGIRQLAERDQRGGRREREAERGDAEPVDGGAQLANAECAGREGLLRGVPSGQRRQAVAQPGRRDVADTDGGRRQCGDLRHIHRFPPGPAAISGWDGPQPAICRGDDGVPGRSHRLRLLGNAVVRQQAALAWRTLIARAAGVDTGAAA